MIDKSQLTKVSTGTYANVFVNSTLTYILKEYSLNIDVNSTMKLLEDYLLAKNLFNRLNSSAFQIPQTYNFCIKSNPVATTLSLIEDYCGTNIRTLYKQNQLKYQEKTENIKKLIMQLPENMPIETHPGNICVFRDSYYIVDFFPPFPHFGFYAFENSFYEEARLLRKLSRYYNNNLRVQKFEFYLN